MGKLTKKEVRHVAKLSKLNLTEKEVEAFTSQLSEVVDYMDILAEAKTENIEPTSQTTGLENKTRSDKIDHARILPVEKATSGTDEIHNNYFKVKGILNKDE